MNTDAELADLVNDFAADLALAVPDPAAWGTWLEILIEELERYAAETGQPAERYNLTLELLRRVVERRLQAHDG